jgi:ABC-type polysaccharide/polyol phosphate export permease
MNVKIRFRGTLFGLLWTAFEPLLLFVFLYVLFTNIKVAAKEDFAMYLLIGIVIYHSFTRGSQAGLVSLRENYSILSSLNIKKEVFPVISTTTTLLLLFVEIGVFFAMMPLAGFTPSWTIIMLPAVFGLLILLILGISYFLSITYVYVRDIQPLWGVFVSALFFITPVFWYLDDASGIVHTIQQFNPLGQIVELAHKLVFGQIPLVSDWVYTGAIVGGILISGFVLFQRFEKNVVEIL